MDTGEVGTDAEDTKEESGIVEWVGEWYDLAEGDNR